MFSSESVKNIMASFSNARSQMKTLENDLSSFLEKTEAKYLSQNKEAKTTN